MTGKSEPCTVSDLVFSGNQDPDHPAIETPGYRPLTYRDLRHQVLQVIKTLHAMGFGRNDRIAVIMPGGPETAVLGIAIMAGFTYVPLNPQLREPEFQAILPRLKVKAVIVGKNHETAVRSVALSHHIPIIEVTPHSDPAGSFTLGDGKAQKEGEVSFAQSEDIVLVMQTSGTTSLPKIVPLTQKQLLTSVITLSSQSNHSDQDRSLHIVPHFHLLGIFGTLLAPLYAGGTVICTRNFIASDFLLLLKNHRPTFYIAGPAHHHAILQEIRKIPSGELKNNSLRFLRSVSAPMPALVRSELEALLGVPLIESYGMTESPLITLNLAQKEASVGIPIIEAVVVMDDDGALLPAFETGEVAVRGEGVFSGYEDAPADNASAFMNGWFRTGDMGYFDDEGYLYLTGRKKEFINKGGEKISPVEIDQVLMSHTGVNQAMAFRIPDTVLGEDIAAVVVLENKDLREEDLRRYLLERLAPFKVPRRIFCVDTVPKGPTGKLLRYVGTERYTRGEFEDTRAPGVKGDPTLSSLTSTMDNLQQIWKEVLDTESVSPDDDFFRCGGNSLTAIELLIKIQRAFHGAFPPDMVYLHPTIRKQAVLITGLTGTGTEYHPLIVPIRGNGTQPPLFCFHPLGGWINEYKYISSFLDKERPVFGIRARGLEPEEKPARSVEEAALEYIEAIKTVQKEGPYHLLGFSGGALYALELACQLQKRGESVAWLGIIDMSLPAPQKRLFNQIKYEKPNMFFTAGQSVYSFLNNRLKTKPDSFLYSFFVKGVGVISNGLIALKGLPFLSVPEPDAGSAAGTESGWISTFPEQQRYLVKTQIGSFARYRPRIFSGDISLFSTGLDTEFYPDDPARGWKVCATGKVHVIDIPGDHISLHEDPLGQVTAAKIEESLKEAGIPGKQKSQGTVPV